ncbi:hypothetical protein HPB47_020754 [Ixodes persulcatus]|uniref:Uncharacterized protein n=1 Tax=Ixodes persulcatus TaxID=34615 RepID=A0AC60QGP3_IXOPE|nr:hypothetical protein HPB47_020754 [Ixodes persulcatus]
METKFRESDVPESNLEPVIIPLDASDTEEESGDDDEADDEDEAHRTVKRSTVNACLLFRIPTPRSVEVRTPRRAVSATLRSLPADTSRDCQVVIKPSYWGRQGAAETASPQYSRATRP